MRNLIFILLFSFNLFAQKNFDKKIKPIVEEGKMLYKSEMASWYGTDLFLENFKEREKIGGYFSYVEKDKANCIFFSKSENPKVIGTISFDSTYNVKTAILSLDERNFSKSENDLYQIRKIALNELQTDTLFKFYQNTNPNLIPIIRGKEKKVYILTGSKESGVVIFGNDYLITFDKKNKITSKKQLHKNIIPIYYGEDESIESAMHNHLPETGDFMTATDICTIMLYEKFAKWKTYQVFSKKYLNIWSCDKDELFIMTMDAVKKINEHQEKEKNENKE